MAAITVPTQHGVASGRVTVSVYTLSPMTADSTLPEEIDVLIAGAGNAACCAALSAREVGLSVLVCERAPEAQSGGNSRYTAGAMRVVYNSVDDLRQLMPELTDEECANADFGCYSREDFFDDMARITQYRCDPTLTDLLVENSFNTLSWMQDKGVRFMPMYARQAFRIDGRFRFWGGLTVEAWGGGPGLVEQLHKALNRENISLVYDCRVHAVNTNPEGVSSVDVIYQGQPRTVRTRSVVLACGGFEANRMWRTRYLGPGWELAKVRGTRYNTGDGIRMGLAAGAGSAGHWSGCHAVGWDANAPEFGDLNVGDGYQKHSYPFGIMVNARGDRFVDEGADFRNYTYARYGREILAQPGQFAWQVFDRQVTHLLRDEYRIREVSKVQAESLPALAEKLEGVDPEGFLETVRQFNAAVQQDVPFDPTVKDERGTSGLTLNKTHWANPLTEPPFVAYQITCGITFTFGGLKIDEHARVLDESDQPIPGLHAAGEMVGGLFYFNYPGGTGLTSGAVFGRIAGRSAAAKVTA